MASKHLQRTDAHTKQIFWVSACLILLALIAYWPVFRCDFINFDDPDYVTANSHVKSGLSWSNCIWAFRTTSASNWHPLTWLSHMADCQFFGLNPAGHHASNLIIHIANSLLLLGLLKEMTGSVWRSALVAALFSIHPLHVESVAWISERKDVLSTFLWILTTWTYVRHVKTHRVSFYLLSVFFYTMGLLSKPMVVTLPFTLLLLDIWPLKRLQQKKLPKGQISAGHQALAGQSAMKNTRFLITEKLPFFLLSSIACVVTYHAQSQSGAVSSMESLPLLPRVCNAILAYQNYIFKMIWPSPLAVFYPRPVSIPIHEVFLAFLLLAAITLFAASNLKKRPHLLIGWLWYLGTLVPVIGLVQVGDQAMADRYTYIPMLGLFIMAVWSIPELTKAATIQTVSVAGTSMMIIPVLMFLTWHQLGYWRNNLVLFEHDLAVTTNNAHAHFNLGNEEEKQGHEEAALNHYQATLRINPNYVDARYNLASVLSRRGQSEEAVTNYLLTLQMAPQHVLCHLNLGNTLMALGRTQSAMEHYETAIKLKPDNADVHYNMAIALSKLGKTDDAISQYNLTLQIKPDYAEAHNNLGNLLLSLGSMDQAIAQYKETIRLKPNAADTYNNLGMVLASQRKRDDASVYFRKAISLKPDYPIPMNELAWILATNPDPGKRNGIEAVQLAKKACVLSGGTEVAFFGTLDAAYAASGQFDAAIQAARKTREMALAAGDKRLAELTEKRLQLYQSGQAFHETDH